MIGGDGIEPGPAPAKSSDGQIGQALQEKLGEACLGTVLALIVVIVGVFGAATALPCGSRRSAHAFLMAKIEPRSLAIHEVHHHRHRVVKRLIQVDHDRLMPLGKYADSCPKSPTRPGPRRRPH